MQEGSRMLKVILIGDQGVGKSSILGQYVHNSFPEFTKNTIGVEFGRKQVQVEKKMVEMQIWDTAGQEQFRSMARSFYQGAAAVFIVYSCNSLESFLKVSEWLAEVEQSAHEKIVKVLVGNKNDLDRLVTYDDGKKLMNDKNMDLFFETSAKTGQNVEVAFQECVKAIFLRMALDSTFAQSLKQFKKTPSSSRPQSNRLANSVPVTARGPERENKPENPPASIDLAAPQNKKKPSGCC